MTEDNAPVRHGPPWWAILLIALAAAAGAYFGQQLWRPDGAMTGSVLPGDGVLIRYPVAKAVSPVELIDRHGQPWSPEALRGRYTVAFFGFTHCPDICPTALAMLKSARQQWQALPEAQQPQVLFVSVDPKRDTPTQLGQYVDFFDPAILAVTGQAAQMLPWTRSLGIVYEFTATGPGEFDYTVDHSGSILLIDPQLQLIGIYRPPHNAAQLAASVAGVVQANAP